MKGNSREVAGAGVRVGNARREDESLGASIAVRIGSAMRGTILGMNCKSRG